MALTGTEKALKLAKELLATLNSPSVRSTAATETMIEDIYNFLAAYGISEGMD